MYDCDFYHSWRTFSIFSSNAQSLFSLELPRQNTEPFVTVYRSPRPCLFLFGPFSVLFQLDILILKLAVTFVTILTSSLSNYSMLWT